VNVTLRPVFESVTVTVPEALTSPVVRLLPVTVPIVALLSVIVSGPGVTDPPPLAVSVALSAYVVAALSVTVDAVLELPRPLT
jgi:hypothetical protein